MAEIEAFIIHGKPHFPTLVNVYVALPVFTSVAGRSYAHFMRLLERQENTFPPENAGKRRKTPENAGKHQKNAGYHYKIHIQCFASNILSS